MAGKVMDEPKCGICRWQKAASVPADYVGTPPVTLGLRVQAGGWNGVEMDGRRFEALGAHYCEHPKQPRGLVLTNYACRNFEWPPSIDDQDALPPAGRAALSQQTGSGETGNE